jgi:hypothetical protein
MQVGTCAQFLHLFLYEMSAQVVDAAALELVQQAQIIQV